MTDAVDATFVGLYVTFPAADPAQSDLVLAAFRDLHLIGGILPGEDDASGALTTVVAAHLERGLLVWATDGEVATTPAREVIATLAARLRAAIYLDLGDDAAVSVDHATWDTAPRPGEGDTARANASLEKADSSPSREISLVAGKIALSPDRRAEIALQVGGGVTVLRDHSRTVLLPDAGIHSSYWPPAQRPVVSLVAARNTLRLSVFLPLPARGVPLRERLAAGAIPDAVLLWQPAPRRSHVPTASAAEALQNDLFARMRADNLADGARLGSSDALASLGIDVQRIAELADGLLREDTLEHILVAWGLDAPTTATESGARAESIAAVLRGERDAATVPDALYIPRAGLRRALIEGVLAEPEGRGLWARWRRVAHRRPRLAAILTLLEALAASVLVFAALTPPYGQPLTMLQWVIAGVLTVDVATDVVLLVALRRRRRVTSE